MEQITNGINPKNKAADLILPSPPMQRSLPSLNPSVPVTCASYKTIEKMYWKALIPWISISFSELVKQNLYWTEIIPKSLQNNSKQELSFFLGKDETWKAGKNPRWLSCQGLSWLWCWEKFGHELFALLYSQPWEAFNHWIPAEFHKCGFLEEPEE